MQQTKKRSLQRKDLLVGAGKKGEQVKRRLKRMNKDAASADHHAVRKM